MTSAYQTFSAHEFFPATIYAAFVVFRRKSDSGFLATGIHHEIVTGRNPLTAEEFIARVRQRMESQWDETMHGKRSLYEFSYGGCSSSVLSTA